MPWQRLVADVAGEYNPDTGIPYYREVVVTVPRQAGKTTLVLAFKVQRCIGWGSPQIVAHTAQTGQDAGKKLIDDEAPLLMASPLKPLVERVIRTPGAQNIRFTNGSRIEAIGSTSESGHGRTFDLGFIDEAMKDGDDRREQALIPTLSTRKDAQLLIVSTAGDAKAAYLRRKVEMGRQLVIDDTGSGIAFFEWRAPDDADPDDPASWWACHPALGHTINEDTIRHARQTMSDGEFRRAFMNQWTSTEERIIPSVTWDAVNSPDAAGTGRMTLAVDVNEDRSAAAILAISADRVIEVVEHRPGIAWILDRCEEIDKRQPGATWAADTSGPVGSLVPELERRVRSFIGLKGGELSKASGMFYDAVADGTIKVRRHPGLDDAVAGAARRISNDSWMWSRKAGSSDSSPLVAATVGLWIAAQAGSSDQFFASWR